MKKVLIYGFTQNQAVFLTPAVNCILGECKIFAANDAVDVNLKNESETVIIVTIGGEIPSNIPDNASTAAISVEGIAK